MECHTHHNACDCREKRFRQAIADAVNRPKGIIPDSAAEFYDQDLAPEHFRIANDAQYDLSLAMFFSGHGISREFSVWLAKQVWLYGLGEAGSLGSAAGERIKDKLQHSEGGE